MAITPRKTIKDPYAKERAAFHANKNTKDVDELTKTLEAHGFGKRPQASADDVEKLKKEILENIEVPEVDYALLKEYIVTQIVNKFSKIKTPKDGKDGKSIRGPQGPAGKDGRHAVVDLDALVNKVLARLPKQKEGSSLTLKEIKTYLDEAIKKIPPQQQIVRVGGSVASIRALTDVNLDGLSQDAQGNYILGGNSLPSQTGNNGKFLKTDGTDPVWESIPGGGDMLAATYDPQAIAGDAFDTDNHTDGTTNKVFTATEKTKLAGIEASADVTDATNVAASGAFMKSVDDTDDITVGTTNKFATAAEKTKLGHITVTQAVDLDQMETDIAALANGMVYKGNWDASAGTFPGAGAAQMGWFYTVSVGGTVNSVVFNVGDRLIAIVDNASTTTYAANWTQLDATDAVTSVAGRTGNVVITASDLADFDTEVANNTAVAANTAKISFDSASSTKLAGIETAADVTDAANVGAVNAAATSKATPVNADSFPIVDSEAANAIKRVTGTNLKAFLKTYFDTIYAALAGSISQVFAVSTLEVGHATDTTISRVSAGVIAVEGKTILTTDGGTLTGNLTLGENTSIDLDPAGSADGKYSGICITGTAGATLAFGDLIYLAVADSRWELCDADATATAGTPLIGMCVLAAASDGSATKILLQGTIRADAKFPALTIGAPAYVGETAGAIQTAIPTGADNVIRVVGRALTADELYFCPSQDHQITVA